MSWLDLVILALLGIPALLGFRTGIVSAAATLAGIVAGVVLAGRFHGQASALLGTFIADEGLARAVGFIVILLGTIVVAWIVAGLLRRVLVIGWVDKAGGVVFGLLMASIFVSVIIFLLEVVPSGTTNRAVADSFLASFFQDVVFPLVRRLPGNIESIREGI